MISILKSPIGLSATGSGPKIFRPAFFTVLAAILCGIFFPAVADIPFTNADLRSAGYVWIALGTIFWIWSLAQFLSQFSKGKLITNGIYAFSRNPIYASWIVFILPSFAMLFNNWIFLLAALLMFISFSLFIKEEEEALAAIFGDEYSDYTRNVSRVLFFTEPV